MCIYICAYVCMYIYIYICVCVMYICTQIHIYIYIYIERERDVYTYDIDIYISQCPAGCLGARQEEETGDVLGESTYVYTYMCIYVYIYIYIYISLPPILQALSFLQITGQSDAALQEPYKLKPHHPACTYHETPL